MARNTKLEPKDVIKDVIFFIFTVAGTFAYVLFILLILSFMFLRFFAFFNLEYEHMLIISGVAAGISAVCYIIKMIRKYSV